MDIPLRKGGIVEMEQHARTGVLKDLKVLEIAQLLSAPMAGCLIADQGADVIHIDSPGIGDPVRYIGPDKDGVHLWWKVCGRNKRSITLDLHSEEGQQLTHRLVKWADVVITNFRVRTLEKWRLDWKSLHEVNPRLIYLNVCGNGLGTSDENAPGFGKVGEARSGVVHLTGFPDGPPIHTGFSHADTVTGLMGAFAITAACVNRHKSDFDGEMIDLALFETLFRLADWQVTIYDQLGVIPQRSGNHLPIGAMVINTYPTSDDQWVTVTSGTRRSILNILNLLGLDEIEYLGPNPRSDAKDEIDRQLKEWISTRSVTEALKTMRSLEVVAEKVYNVEDIVNSPLYAEREDVITVEDSELGPIRMAGVIPKFINSPGSVWRGAPSLGQDTEEICQSILSLSVDDIGRLRTAGVI